MTKQTKLKIRFLSWIAALTIMHLMVEKVFFEIPKPMMDKDIEFYQPKSEAESSLREMNLYIHDKNLITELTIETGKKKVDDDYMVVLREYHNQMLELYRIISSKTLAMSINKMSENIDISRKYTGSDQCLIIDGTQDVYNKLIVEYPPLINKINERPQAILNIHKRIFNIAPEEDANGEFNVDGAIERIDIIRELMDDPYLSVRKNNTAALLEINEPVTDSV